MFLCWCLPLCEPMRVSIQFRLHSFLFCSDNAQGRSTHFWLLVGVHDNIHSYAVFSQCSCEWLFCLWQFDYYLWYLWPFVTSQLNGILKYVNFCSCWQNFMLFPVGFVSLPLCQFSHINLVCTVACLNFVLHKCQQSI